MADHQRMLHERYELRAQVGRGGMGRVWRAHDTRLNRTVAVKELLLGPGLDEAERTRVTSRARREAQATAMGQHPNIVTVHDIVEEDGRPWIIMEFLEGCSLHHLVRDEGPQQPTRVAAWGLELLDALETAHTQGITHRDVKPENVMITDTGRVVLTDFGIAAIADTTALTQTASVMGSPAYLAPERLASTPASPAGDLWSLGATLHHLATGVSPFQREGLPATLHAVLNAEPPRISPGPLGLAVQGLLIKDPGQRLNAVGCRRLLEEAAGQGAAKTQQPQNTPDVPRARASTAQAPIAGRGAADAHPGPVPATAMIPPTGAPSGPYHVMSSPSGPVPTPTTGHVLPPGPATPRIRRLSWPVVVLTLGLATLLVATALVVFNPWPGEERTVAAGADQHTEEATGNGDTTVEAEAPRTQETPPTPSPESEVEVDFEGTPTGPAMTWTQDGQGFALLVPDGWTRRTEGASVFYESPTHNSYVQIDHTAHPTDDQHQHVLDQEEASIAAERLPGYERVRVQDVTSRTSFHSAAEWEFTWDQSGVPRRLLARNITASPGEHYTVAFAADEGMWAQHTGWREHALASFDPF